MKTAHEKRVINALYLIETEEGGNKAAFAKKIDTDPSYLYQIFSPKITKKNYGPDLARRTEVTYNKPRGWMDSTHDFTSSFADSGTETGGVAELSQDYHVSLTNDKKVFTTMVSALVDDSDVLFIPVLENAASMGSGKNVLQRDVVKGFMPVSEDWARLNLRLSRGTLEQLRVVPAFGTSMEPTLRDGDLVLVDTSIKAHDVNGIYVFYGFERLFIKRVSRDMHTGRFIVKSDNPAEEDKKELNGLEELNMIGRVVWAWNGIKM